MTYMYYRIRGADSQSGNREWRLYQKSDISCQLQLIEMDKGMSEFDLQTVTFWI